MGIGIGCGMGSGIGIGRGSGIGVMTIGRNLIPKSRFVAVDPLGFERQRDRIAWTSFDDFHIDAIRDN